MSGEARLKDILNSSHDVIDSISDFEELAKWVHYVAYSYLSEEDRCKLDSDYEKLYKQNPYNDMDPDEYDDLDKSDPRYIEGYSLWDAEHEWREKNDMWMSSQCFQQGEDRRKFLPLSVVEKLLNMDVQRSKDGVS